MAAADHDPVAVDVLALLTGPVRPFRADEPSAIAKSPVIGPVSITAQGFAGDEQADRRNHGGVDKAVHHYPFDHYAFWLREMGEHGMLLAPGSFGENISTRGLTEDQVWLGDRFRLGSALLEVSHGRQPCWKLQHHFARADLLARVVRTGRAGWYYRVLEPGRATAGDGLRLVERGLPEWNLARLFAVLIGDRSERNPRVLRELTALPVLAEAWRRRARDLAGEN